MNLCLKLPVKNKDIPILANLRKELKAKANPKRAKNSQRYFKTGKGEYGEGDEFLGISSLVMRPMAKRYKDLRFKDLRRLLKSKIHEERQIALLILVYQYKKGSQMNKRQIFNFYLKNTRYINNWDLVDLSAPKIVGNYLACEKRTSALAPLALRQYEIAHANKLILYRLAKSKNIWERRIAMLATFAFIRQNRFNETLKISEMLLNDKHDLMHKAVGWMLREVGKKSQTTLEKFLKKYTSKMPRVMLRYAIERLSETERKYFLSL